MNRQRDGRQRRQPPPRPPPPKMTAKRVKQIARVTDRKTPDTAKFSRPKSETAVSDVRRYPKQTMTVRLHGMQACGWDGSSDPPHAIISAYSITQNFKDYVPAFFMVNHITIISCRTVTEGALRGKDSGEAYPILTSLAWNALGNWLGFSASVTSAAYDIIRSGIMEMLSGVGRTKQTYYPSHRDQAIVFKTEDVEKNNGAGQANVYTLEIALDGATPFFQCEDILVDINVTRWAFGRTLSHQELMKSDPEYRS